MTIDASVLSLLPALGTGTGTGVATDVTSTVLSIIYGHGPSGTTGTQANPVIALQIALATEKKTVAAIAAQPQTARDIAAFRAAVATAKSPADLLANPNTRKILLTANGLANQAGYPALVTKALLSDTTKTGNLASRLANTQFLATAKTYDFANQGLALLQKPGVVDSIVNGYAEVQWRNSLNQTTPGLSNALDFRSRAASIKSADQILGDSTLRTVVTTALGIPRQIAFQPLQAQEQAITSRLDLKHFADPSFVDQFTKRYLITEQANTTSTATTNSLIV